MSVNGPANPGMAGAPPAPGANGGWNGQAGDPAQGAGMPGGGPIDPNQLPGAPGGPGLPGGPGMQPGPEGEGGLPPADSQAALPPTQPTPVRVDLLPQSYRDKLVLARAQRRAILILLVALLVVAVGYVLGMLRVGAATESRNEAQLQQAQAQSAVNKLSEVPKTQAQVAELKKSLESVLGNEVLFSALTAETFAALPPGTLTVHLVWTLTPGAASTSGKQAGATKTVGDMRLSGCTPAFVTSADVIEGLEKVPKLTGVWIDSASRGNSCGEGSYDIESSAGIAPGAMSGRYSSGGGAK